MGDSSVLVRCLMPHLPGAVHLIAEAPEFDAKRLFSPVFSAEIAQIGSALDVAVLNHILCFRHAACTKIDRVHRLHIRLLRPVHELMKAELVRLNHAPRRVDPVGSLADRTDRILPLEPGDKVSARIADIWDLQFFDQVDGIRSQPILIGEFAARLIDSFIYRPSQMLDKRAEDPLIYPGYFNLTVNTDSCLLSLFHDKLPSNHPLSASSAVRVNDNLVLDLG